MAISKGKFVDIELSSGQILRTFSNVMLGEGDNTANRFGVRIFDHGEPVTLSGASCIAYFIRSDGITLVLNGVVSQNTAYIDLPEAAYAQIGVYTLTIKITGSGYASTVLMIDGTIVETTSGSLSDPESSFPDPAEYLEYVERAEAAAAEIENFIISASQITGTRYKITVTVNT